jgi:NAD(P)-dependent dehydrogenase (short-subunit alcohol dehydrogenase family)
MAVGDLAARDAGAAVIASALDAFGRLDQVVHNAGFADRSPFGDLKREGLEASLAAMPIAFLEIVTAALPELAASPHGRVVAVSSFVAHRYEAGRLFPASAAAKAALEALAKSLAAQLAPSGTTVNIVVPGYTKKDEGKTGALSLGAWAEVASLSPQHRLATTQEIAAAIAFLLSDEASHITGTTLHVDGGLTLA